MYIGLAGAQTQLHGGFQGFEGVVVGQRHGAGRVRHEVDGPPGALLQGGGDVAHVAEGGAHQQELRVRQREQRHLPGPAAIGVGVEVELVHHHAGHLRRGALAQGLVREDLRRAADDRRLGVDGGVPVIMPTFSRPRMSTMSKNFSDTSALMGAV